MHSIDTDRKTATFTFSLESSVVTYLEYALDTLLSSPTARNINPKELKDLTEAHIDVLSAIKEYLEFKGVNSSDDIKEDSNDSDDIIDSNDSKTE